MCICQRWHEFVATPQNRINSCIIGKCSYLLNTNEKKVVEVSIFDYLDSEFGVVSVLPNITYRDNYSIKIDDLDSDLAYSIRTICGADVKYLYFKLKNPEFLNGQNQVYYKNDGNMSFALSVNKDELDKDGKLYIDGSLLDKSKYTTASSEDGVKITLNKDYIDSLGVGNHEIKVSLLHGDVTTSFMVNKRLINPSTGNKVIFIISIIALVSMTLLRTKRNLKTN